jgi:hypothetical protein
MSNQAKSEQQQEKTSVTTVGAILSSGASLPPEVKRQELFTSEELYDLGLLSEDTQSKFFYNSDKGLVLCPDGSLCKRVVTCNHPYRLEIDPLELSLAGGDFYGRKLWFVSCPTTSVGSTPVYQRLSRDFLEQLIESRSTEKVNS